MSTVRAIAVVLPSPHDDSLLLVVQRPHDDEDLPGVWGLPATTVRPHESDADAAVRLGESKLGAPVSLGPLLAEGSQQRNDTELAMRLYAATMSSDEPALPSAPGEQGVTYYADWRWAPKSSLRDGAERGSLCCALALGEHEGRVTAMDEHVLVRFYHEIALKGSNRSWFLKHMGANLRRALAGTGVGRIRWNAMMASFPLKDDGQWELVRERLEGVIGVERFSRAVRVEATLDAIKDAMPAMLEDKQPASFRIAARRSDKRFPMTSPEINHALGRHVQELTGWPVDLKQADLTLHVQMTEREALLSAESLPGPGGMPVGVGGHVAALLSGGIDSPVAAYQMMRRGCRVTFVHFHSFPLVEGTSREKAEELVELLTRYQFNSRLLLVPFAAAQQRIIVTVPPAYRVAVYRRFMVRIAEALALRHGAAALVTGDSLGQVSSQTLENLTTIGAAVERLPMFRPLLTMDKGEIIDIARPLGTYPISIIPDQDCCSLFVPRHPVIKSRIQDVERMEAELPVQELVDEAVEAAEEREFRWPESAARREQGTPAASR